MLKTGYLICSILALFAFFAGKGPNLSRYTASIELGLQTYGDPAEAEKILKQDFFFLASGGQCDVFASKDGKYVLKFFKNTPLPLPFSSYRGRKLSKLVRDLRGYALGFERLRDETGLIFARLSAKTPFACPVRLFDALGCLHTFDLKNSNFAIQRRAEPLVFPLAPEKLGEIFALLQKQADAKIEDADPRQHKNIGLLDDKPLFLDPGKFTHNPQAKAAFSEKFEQWQKKS